MARMPSVSTTTAPTTNQYGLRDTLQCVETLFDIWRVIGNERQDEWCERSHKQQSVSIKSSSEK